jgi:thioredoxin-like negative regulator of GroEL
MVPAMQDDAPHLEQVKTVLGDRIRIIKVDVDKYGVTANQYGIQSVPTLMLFRHGEVLVENKRCGAEIRVIGND